MNKTKRQLNQKFLTQHFDKNLSADAMEHYLMIAHAYAETEHVIAVLSDLRNNSSHVFYGKLANTLAIEEQQTEIPSIWETQILALIHPDDLQRKQLEEMKFFDFISSLPQQKRSDYYLQSPLRMRSKTGAYLPIRHRIFYFDDSSRESVRLALCLYSIAANERLKTEIINAVTGETIGLNEQNNNGILSKREVAVLRLVAQGLRSNQIAEQLNISIHTVHRHRQNVIQKLQVSNSTDACGVAKELGLI